MSKAFVNEDSVLNEDLVADFEPSDSGERNYITKHGFETLKMQLQQLMEVDRPAAAETVDALAENPESVEATDAKKKLRELDRRIRHAQKRVDLAEVVDPETQAGDHVLFGATVTVEDESEALRTYRIVGVDETDISTGKVSWNSPIGKALLQAKVGDFVSFETPTTEEELEIKKIEFLPI